MPISPRMLKASALLLSGAALGGAGGYAASASGASASHATTPTKKAAHTAALQKRLRRDVSISAVVPAGHGSFATVTIERGSLLSSSAGSITLAEGSARSSYKTVTLSLPSSTVVRLSRRPSSLSALAPGDRVTVIQGPRRSAVLAHPKS